MRRTVRDPIDPHVATSVLDNGLRVVTVQLPHLHTCTLALYLRAGPRFETPAENGLSHMVEHMLFRGTTRHRSEMIRRTAEHPELARIVEPIASMDI